MLHIHHALHQAIKGLAGHVWRSTCVSRSVGWIQALDLLTMRWILVGEEVFGWGGEGAALGSDWDGLGEMVGIKTKGT